MKFSIKMNWLNVIRPDWFDVNSEMRLQVQTYLIIKNIIETRENRFFNDVLIKLVLENTELDSYRSVIIHHMMQYEQWTWIQLLVKYEHDWSFLHTQSTKVKIILIVISIRYVLKFIDTGMVIDYDGILERVFREVDEI